EPTVGFQLVHEVGVECVLSWRKAGKLAGGQRSLERTCTYVGRQAGYSAVGIIDARHDRSTLRDEPSENCVLRGRRAENIRVGQERNGILRILGQPFEGQEDKRLVLVDRKTHVAAELIARQRILD